MALGAAGSVLLHKPRAYAEVYNDLDGEIVNLRCDLYDELFGEWRRVDKATHADSASARVESLWISRNCPQQELFWQDRRHTT